MANRHSLSDKGNNIYLKIKNKNMQLIKGTFKTQDALQIISRLVEVKIKFHEDKIGLSQSEEDIKMRERRIKELQRYLKETRDALIDNPGEINMDAIIHLNQQGHPSSRFRLIDGTFQVQDAKDLLMAAFDSKIQFHSLAAFSKLIRGDAGVEIHQQRAKELRDDSNKVRDFLENAESAGKKVMVSCHVVISEIGVPEDEPVQKPEVSYSL